MNPFSCRCCQHNHAQGWPYYAEHLILATPDNGAAVALYASCQAEIMVGNHQKIKIIENTNYPSKNVSVCPFKQRRQPNFRCICAFRHGHGMLPLK